MSCLQCCRSIIGIVQESHFSWPVLDEDTKNEDFSPEKDSDSGPNSLSRIREFYNLRVSRVQFVSVTFQCAF